MQDSIQIGVHFVTECQIKATTDSPKGWPITTAVVCDLESLRPTVSPKDYSTVIVPS